MHEKSQFLWLPEAGAKLPVPFDQIQATHPEITRPNVPASFHPVWGVSRHRPVQQQKQYDAVLETAAGQKDDWHWRLNKYWQLPDFPGFLKAVKYWPIEMRVRFFLSPVVLETAGNGHPLLQFPVHAVAAIGL